MNQQNGLLLIYSVSLLLVYCVVYILVYLVVALLVYIADFSDQSLKFPAGERLPAIY